MPSAIAVAFVSDGFDWKSFFQMAKNCWLIILSNFSIRVYKTCWLRENKKGKKHLLNLCQLLQEERVAFQINLLYPWWLGVLLLFFFSKFSLAKAVMVVLRIVWINRSNILLHSDTNTYLFSTSCLNRVEIYFPTYLMLLYRFWCWIKIFGKLFCKRIYRRFNDVFSFIRIILFCSYSGCPQFFRFIIGNVTAYDTLFHLLALQIHFSENVSQNFVNFIDASGIIILILFIIFDNFKFDTDLIILVFWDFLWKFVPSLYISQVPLIV